MVGKKLPKSVRKFIRLEKARIRRQVFRLEEREKLISELYYRFSPKSEKQSVKVETKVEIPKEKAKMRTKS